LERINISDKSAKLDCHERLLEAVARIKQRNFCVDVVSAMLKGAAVDDALTQAAKDNFQAPGGALTDSSGLSKGRSVIEKPNVMRGMEILFEEAGISPQKAASIHVGHIEGISYDTTVFKNGVPIDVTIKQPPNYQALKDYWALTVPRPATKLEVRSTNVTAMIDRPASPLMASRSLKKVESRETD
jgi:hypothetical protein